MLAVAMAFILFIQPAAALTEMAVPFVTTDSVVFVQPLELADLVITEFNQTNYAEYHLGDLEISSPVFDHATPDHGDGLALVSPVLPSMKQKTEDIIKYDRTYFFTDSG